MLDASGPESRFLTAAHCRLTDSACADRLQDLDPAGTTISCAAGNLRELRNQPYAEAIASATLMTSLIPMGRSRGVSKEELIRHVAEPGCDPNQFEATLEAFRRYGSYFHREEERFYFDIEENEEAKVELEAYRSGSDEAARQQISELWLRDLFKDSQQAVLLNELEATRAALATMSKTGPRFVLAPRRLSNPERHAIYRGAEFRNQIILLEPRDDQANHLTNPDLLAAAKRYAAARSLAGNARTADRRDSYEKISVRERKLLLDTLKQGGLVFIRVEKWEETPDKSVFEIEPLAQAATREEVINQIRTQIYPQTYFTEHLRDRLANFIGQSVAQVDRIYRTTLGFPVPLKDDMMARAIRSLVEDTESRPLGLRGPRGRDFCAAICRLVSLGIGRGDFKCSLVPFRCAHSNVSAGFVPNDRRWYFADSNSSIPTSSPLEAILKHWERRPGRSLGELRQQIASRLVEVEGPSIEQVIFQNPGQCSGHGIIWIQLRSSRQP